MLYNQQIDKLDCGISVIQSLYKFYFGKQIDLLQIKSNVNYVSTGITINEFSNVAKKFGIKTKVLKGNFSSFEKVEIDEPIVSIIKNENFFHYIILQKKTNKNNIIYFDPILGKRKISIKEFEKIFSGILIICQKNKKSKLNIEKKIDFFSFEITKEKVVLSMSSIFIIIFSFVLTFYLKIVLDRLIPINQKNSLFIITILFVFVFILKTILEMINQKIIDKFEISIQTKYINMYIQKIKSVKWILISHMDESIHLKNLDILLKVSSFKAKNSINIISQSFSFVVSLFVLISINLEAFLISFFSILILLTISGIFQCKFKWIDAEVVNSSTVFKNKYLNIINGINQFKLFQNNVLEKQFDKSLQDIKIKQAKVSYISLFYKAINSLIAGIIPYVIVILCAQKIWINTISIGQTFLFLSIFNFFMMPLNFYASLLIQTPIIKQYISNLNVFFSLEEDLINVEKREISEIKSIHIKNINFNYPNSQTILKIEDVFLDSHYKVVGSNGSGKSTFFKILSTLISDQKIEYNGNDKDVYNLTSIREQMCLIFNNEYLPNVTIYDYLTSNNQNKIKNLLDSLEKYKLLSLFDDMNLSLHSWIETGGKNLSSGQKQFISVMKIFSINPSVVLLDEAFENIDENIVKKLFPILRSFLSEKIVLEISHRKNYLFNKSKEIDCDKFK